MLKYMTNELPSLVQPPKWNLTDDKVFSKFENVDANIDIIIRNLADMDFPPDQNNLEKLIRKIKGGLEVDSNDKIKTNVEALVAKFCAHINEELKKARDNRQIIVMADPETAIS